MNQAIYCSDLLAIISDAPQPFTFKGEQFTGTISGKTDRKTLELGGFDEAPELTLVISLRDADGTPTMAALPTVGEQITIGTKNYRVERTDIDQFNAGFQMDLRSVNL